MKKLLLLLLLLPNVAFAWPKSLTINGELLLIDYADSEGSSMASLPPTVSTNIFISWKFVKNSRTCKITLRTGGKTLRCSASSSQISCPARIDFFSDQLGPCSLYQKQIFRTGSKGATATVLQDVICPNYPIRALAKYVGLFFKK